MTLVALAAGAIGYFVRRWLSQSRTHERTALLNSLADLRAKMGTAGVGMDQIVELEQMVRGKVTVSPETAEAVTGQRIAYEDDERLPQQYWTMVAMRGRAAARFAVVEAQLDEALIDLLTLISTDEANELNKSHVAWKVYRKRQMNYADKRYPGGTLGPLYGTLHGIEVSERRLAELKREIEARKTERA